MIFQRPPLLRLITLFALIWVSGCTRSVQHPSDQIAIPEALKPTPNGKYLLSPPFDSWGYPNGDLLSMKVLEAMVPFLGSDWVGVLYADSDGFGFGRLALPVSDTQALLIELRNKLLQPNNTYELIGEIREVWIGNDHVIELSISDDVAAVNFISNESYDLYRERELSQVSKHTDTDVGYRYDVSWNKAEHISNRLLTDTFGVIKPNSERLCPSIIGIDAKCEVFWVLFDALDDIERVQMWWKEPSDNTAIAKKEIERDLGSPTVWSRSDGESTSYWYWNNYTITIITLPLDRSTFILERYKS